MIKMFIGSDEVVSNKEFTINEEMLSASSTILNNCYPRSWELTRDYVSNFYYPKDYSKFILGQGDFIHGDTEYSILKASGKNLFNKDTSDFIKGKYLNNVGTIVNGDNWGIYYIPIESGLSYTISGVLTNTGVYFWWLSSDKTPLSLIGSKRNFTNITAPNNAKYLGLSIVWNTALSAYDGTTFMVEQNNTATSYQEYGTNVSFNTNIEKQWNTFNVYGKTTQETRSGKNLLISNNTSQTIDGLTFTHNSDGSIKINGTATAQVNYRINISGTEFSLNNGTYTVSIGNNLSTGMAFYGWHSASTNFVAIYSGNNKQTITLNQDVSTVRFALVVISGTVVNNLTIYPQLETGSSVTEYEQYGAMPSPEYPSELVSVGYSNLLKNTNVNSGDNNYWQTYSTFDEATRTVTRSTTATTESFIYHRLNGLKSGTTYTLTLYAKSNGYVSSMDLFCFNKNIQGVRAMQTLGLTTEYQKYQWTFTTAKDVDYSDNAYLRADNNGSTISGTEAILTVKDVCLVEGDKPCDYIDYGKYGIQIKTIGENLYIPQLKTNGTSIVYHDCTVSLNDDEFSFVCSGTDMFFGQVGNQGSSYTEARGTLFDISGVSKLYFLNTNTQMTANYFTFYNENLISLGYNFKRGNSVNIDVPNGARYLTVRIGNDNASSGTTYKAKVMLSKEPITEYKKYVSNTYLYTLNDPLRSVEGYSDRLYIQNKTLFVERRIGKVVLNGSENWEKINLAFQIRTAYPTDIVAISSEISAYSDYFKYKYYASGITANIQNYEFGWNSSKFLTMRNDNCSTANDFKTWLSTHNVEVNYVLANPITEPIGYIDVPTSYEGWNNVDLRTGLTTGIDVSYYWRNFNVIFSGVVKNSGDISLNPRYPHYCSLQVLDYKTFLSESNTLDFVISNKTIREAIGMVVNAVSEYGFSVGTIDIDKADEVIGAYSTLNKTAYDVLQYLAEISGSKWRTRPLDSTTMAIDFYDPDLLPQSNDILYTQEYWEDNNIVDMTFNYGTRDYRNKQIMLSNEVYANIDYIENLVSNGYNNTYVLQGNVATITSVLVDGEEKTIATTNDKNMGIDADFYFTPGRNTLESNATYSAGTEIDITYTPLVKGRQIVYNADEVDRISFQTDTEGVIARYESRNDVLSSDELEKIAQTYIKYKGKPEVILKITTENKDLFQIGEVAYFDAPIADLKQDYMVKSKETQYIINSDISESKNLFFVYELTSSFNAEKAINYFDNQRNKASGNISEGESITRNIDIENTAKIVWIGATIEQTSVTIVGDNTLNSALNSPLIN